MLCVQRVCSQIRQIKPFYLDFGTGFYFSDSVKEK